MIRTAAFAIAALTLAACGPSTSNTASTTTPAPAAPAAPAQRTPEEIATLVAALPAPYNEGDYQHGRQIAGQCRSCHTFPAGGGNRVGPNLHGLFGRPAGAAEGFAYSDAVKNSNIVWDEATLEQWLAGPRTFLPGNRMSFPGVPNETDRRDLITFLHIETGDE